MVDSIADPCRARFGIEPPSPGQIDDLKIWASILVGMWAAFAPAIVPRIIALMQR